VNSLLNLQMHGGDVYSYVNCAIATTVEQENSSNGLEERNLGCKLLLGAFYFATICLT
jgi:hypothetical protein